MTHRPSLSAIITGHPPGFKRPKPQPGETLADLVIRNFPEQWRSFVDEISNDFAVPPATTEQLLAGRLDAADLTVRGKIEDFINNRLPGYVRTIKPLAELHGDLGQAIGGFRLSQIVWPLERHTGGETAGQAYAKSRGVEVISLPGVAQGTIDLIPLLPFIRGQFAWLVPVGSRLEPFAAAIQLNRTLRMFASDQALAMYSDGLYSVIYRVSALGELAQRGEKSASEPEANARLLEGAGHKVIRGADPPVPLCHLEVLYGGKDPSTHRNGGSFPAARRWWQNLFDKPRNNREAGHHQNQR